MKMKKGRKILFSDLDGTLLNDQKNVEATDREAIFDMIEAGCYFAACTGRPLSSVKKVLQKNNLDGKGCYIVAYNGGVVYEPAADKVISYTAMPCAQAHKMFQKAEQAGFYVHTYDRNDQDTILTIAHRPELDFYFSQTGLSWKTGRQLVDNITFDPPKMIVASMTDHEGLVQFQKENAYWTDKCMNSFFSCDQFLEYCPYGISKGAGIKTLRDYLGLQVEASVAVGDERNDIAMLKAAGTAAVPANAFYEVKDYADYVCEADNNQGAVGEVIRKFIL